MQHSRCYVLQTNFQVISPCTPFPEQQPLKIRRMSVVRNAVLSSISFSMASLNPFSRCSVHFTRFVAL